MGLLRNETEVKLREAAQLQLLDEAGLQGSSDAVAEKANAAA